MARHGFRRKRGGALVVYLDPGEVPVLLGVLGDVASIVADPDDTSVRDRLYPRAYLDPTEEEAEDDFQSLVHDDLAQARIDALKTITDALATVAPDAKAPVEITISAEDETGWLTAFNDARLVIGTMLDVTEEDSGDYPQDDPRFGFGMMYQWLTGLQFELVEILMDERGEGGTEDSTEDGGLAF